MLWAQRPEEIHDGRRSQRVQCGAQIRHCRRQDRSDNQASYPDWEMRPNEFRIGALGNRGRGAPGLRAINIEQHPDQKKKCELEENHHPTGEQGEPALALVARRQQPLNKKLLGSVTRSGQEAASQQSCPEAISPLKKGRGPRKPKIEKLEFVCCLAQCDRLWPSTRNELQD